MRDRFGVSVNDLGRSVPFGEGIHLVLGLSATPGTRTHASVNEWDWAATFADLNAINHAEWYMNVHRDRKIARDPIVLPRPWSESSSAESVTPEERARLRALLVASSPFAHD